jgi:uncharacterized paraquat-inducible protein A
MTGCEFTTRAGACLTADQAYDAGRAIAIYGVMIFIVAIWCVLKFRIYENDTILDRLMNWWMFSVYVIGSLVSLILFFP